MEALVHEGVEHIFGIPGGANLPTYDALVDADLRHIQARHEQAVGHAAEGYAHASGRTGVAFGTSGPGATNLVTAIADANMDSVPMVAITGQVGAAMIGTDAFQEADIVGITLPIVKHSALVTEASQIPEYVHHAFRIASTGRPGPVLVDIPSDLIREEISYTPPTEPVEPTPSSPMRTCKRGCSPTCFPCSSRCRLRPTLRAVFLLVLRGLRSLPVKGKRRALPT